MVDRVRESDLLNSIQAKGYAEAVARSRAGAD